MDQNVKVRFLWLLAGQLECSFPGTLSEVCGLSRSEAFRFWIFRRWLKGIGVEGFGCIVLGVLTSLLWLLSGWGWDVGLRYFEGRSCSQAFWLVIVMDSKPSFSSASVPQSADADCSWNSAFLTRFSQLSMTLSPAATHTIALLANHTLNNSLYKGKSLHLTSFPSSMSWIFCTILDGLGQIPKESLEKIF